MIILEISQNIKEVKEKIEMAAARSGRKSEDITLVAVSKTQPIEKIIEAKESGLNIFGENKVQEIVDKYPNIIEVQWHLIGHLQTNKVKYIIDKVSLIHSLDSISLAEEIDKRAKKANKIMPVLIQINIGKEESKSGIFEEELQDFIEELKKFNNIVIKGIMTIPPKADSDDEARKYFKRMKEIFESLKVYNCENIDIEYLSMGMTGDYEIAIEEGANIIRVGTGIFGERNYAL